MSNRAFALGRLKTGVMNKTEQAYCDRLERMKQMGEVLWFKFEGVKLRLADKTFYSPDFFVMRATGELEAHEVKGFWMDDAKAKIKIAADIYPFRFFAAKLVRKQWEIEEF